MRLRRGSPLEVTEIGSDEWSAFRELRLRALTDAPEAFCSRLADWQGPRDTEDRWRSRIESVDLNVIAYLHQEPVGMASGVMAGDMEELHQNAALAGLDWRAEAAPVELISMWVAPEARGNGVASAVVGAVTGWAAARGRETFLVVRADNARAVSAYTREGFHDLGPRQRPSEGGPPERLMLRLLEPTG